MNYNYKTIKVVNSYCVTTARSDLLTTNGSHLIGVCVCVTDCFAITYELHLLFYSQNELTELVVRMHCS